MLNKDNYIVIWMKIQEDLEVVQIKIIIVGENLQNETECTPNIIIFYFRYY